MCFRVCVLCYIADPPTITGIPSQTTFIEGDVETTITFNNSGTPNPVITCLNESSTQVVNYDRFKCTSGRLVFGPLFESDEGQYTVESVNCFGSNTTQMNIIVNSETHLKEHNCCEYLDYGLLDFLFQDVQLFVAILQIDQLSVVVMIVCPIA